MANKTRRTTIFLTILIFTQTTQQQTFFETTKDLGLFALSTPIKVVNQQKLLPAIIKFRTQSDIEDLKQKKQEMNNCIDQVLQYKYMAPNIINQDTEKIKAKEKLEETKTRATEIIELVEQLMQYKMDITEQQTDTNQCIITKDMYDTTRLTKIIPFCTTMIIQATDQDLTANELILKAMVLAINTNTIAAINSYQIEKEKLRTQLQNVEQLLSLKMPGRLLSELDRTSTQTNCQLQQNVPETIEVTQCFLWTQGITCNLEIRQFTETKHRVQKILPINYKTFTTDLDKLVYNNNTKTTANIDGCGIITSQKNAWKNVIICQHGLTWQHNNCILADIHNDMNKIIKECKFLKPNTMQQPVRTEAGILINYEKTTTVQMNNTNIEPLPIIIETTPTIPITINTKEFKTVMIDKSTETIVHTTKFTQQQLTNMAKQIKFDWDFDIIPPWLEEIGLTTSATIQIVIILAFIIIIIKRLVNKTNKNTKSNKQYKKVVIQHIPLK